MVLRRSLRFKFTHFNPTADGFGGNSDFAGSLGYSK